MQQANNEPNMIREKSTQVQLIKSLPCFYSNLYFLSSFRSFFLIQKNSPSTGCDITTHKRTV
jgi:hypothetical protein